MDPAGALGSACGPLIQTCGVDMCRWLNRQYDYVKHIDSNFEELQQAKQDLINKETEVTKELEENRSDKEKTGDCDAWLKKVERILGGIAEVEYGYRNKPSTCLCGLCPFRALHNLGRRIVKMKDKAASQRDKLRGITIMTNKSVPSGDRWPKNVRIVYHRSLENHVAKLLEWLNDEKKKRISIWGPAGVGKTTIMNTLRERVRQSGQFKHTFSVTLKAERIIEDIQKVILHDLRVDEDEDEDEDEDISPLQRKKLISEKLKEKKYVLFVDQVPSMIDCELEEVGIDSNHKQGWVVFACEKYSGHTDDDEKVDKLSEEDATMLFWEAVGSNLQNRRDINPIAKKIIKECDGMPPILNLTGKLLGEMQNATDPAIWRDMKNQLQSSTQLNEEWEEYYRIFKFAYDKLPDDAYKACLRYWAIFPAGEEIKRDDLFNCWIAEQFLGQRNLHAARDRGHTVLAEFVRKLLVEEGEKLGQFKMFGCFRKAVHRIATLQNQLEILVANDERIEDERWIQAIRVSLARVSSLPESPKCNGMLTLFFQQNGLEEFPAQFFKFMADLQVLGLKQAGITTLPSSISKLKNLKGLFLHNGNQLLQLPRQIGVLHNLIILDVTGIYSLPSEIGQLNNLKCLRVSFRDAGNQNHVRNEMIHAHTIAQLSNLEELSLDVSRSIQRWNEKAVAIATEITNFEQLTHLHFYFANLNSFENFIQESRSWNSNDRNREFVGFRSFRIFIGEQRNSSEPDFNVFECTAEKHLKFSAGTGDAFPSAVILEQAKSFELIGHTTCRNLTGVAHNFEELEACIVENCGAMTSIIDSNSTSNSTERVFRYLKKLHMKNLPNLVSIWEGRVASGSFILLTTLTLKDCGRIEKLFSLEMVRQLSNLQILQVEACANINRIIDAGNPNTRFPNLKNFQLCSLPRLSSICDASFELPSLETIVIERCQALDISTRILVNKTTLKEIHCPEEYLQTRLREIHCPEEYLQSPTLATANSGRISRLTRISELISAVTPDIFRSSLRNIFAQAN